MTYSVGCRHGLDLVLLWLWCRTATAAPIPPLVWELPYATCVALKKKNYRSSHHGTAETNLTRNHEAAGQIPGLTQQVKDPALL